MKRLFFLLLISSYFLHFASLYGSRANSGVRGEMSSQGISEERRKDGCYTNLRENLLDPNADIENPDFVEEAPEEEVLPEEEGTPEEDQTAEEETAPEEEAPEEDQTAEEETAPEEEAPVEEAAPVIEAKVEPVIAPTGMLGIETEADNLAASLAIMPDISSDPDALEALNNPNVIAILNADEDDDNDMAAIAAALVAGGLAAGAAGLLAKKLIDERKKKKAALALPKPTAEELQKQKATLKPLSPEQEAAKKTAEEKRIAQTKAEYLKDQEAKKAALQTADDDKKSIIPKPPVDAEEKSKTINKTKVAPSKALTADALKQQKAALKPQPQKVEISKGPQALKAVVSEGGVQAQKGVLSSGSSTSIDTASSKVSVEKERTTADKIAEAKSTSAANAAKMSASSTIPKAPTPARNASTTTPAKKDNWALIQKRVAEAKAKNQADPNYAKRFGPRTGK